MYNVQHERQRYALSSVTAKKGTVEVANEERRKRKGRKLMKA
jgi:hypothetical protein